jgi:hypothetical protein
MFVTGPFALPLIGNLLPIMRMGLHEYMMQCRLRYGKTFKVTQQLPVPASSQQPVEFYSQAAAASSRYNSDQQKLSASAVSL